MPKVLENLQERILACARVLLLEQGIDGLNIRAVASACGVAVGMVYNYYGSKDQLIASIMLQDWLQNMREAVGEVNAASPSQGMRAICRGIDRFAGRYRLLWLHSVQTRDRSYHDKLVAQLSDLVQVLIARFDLTQEEAAAEFAAENLLRLTLAGKDRYEKKRPCCCGRCIKRLDLYRGLPLCR